MVSSALVATQAEQAVADVFRRQADLEAVGLVEAGQVPGQLRRAGQRGRIRSCPVGEVAASYSRIRESTQVTLASIPNPSRRLGQQDELLMIVGLDAAGVGAGDVEEGGDVGQHARGQRIGGDAVLYARDDVVGELLVEQRDRDDAAVRQIVLEARDRNSARVVGRRSGLPRVITRGLGCGRPRRRWCSGRNPGRPMPVE